MSQLGDQISTVESDLVAVKSDVAALATGISSLNAQIQGLQAQLAGSGISPEDQAALTQLVTDANALKTQADQAAAALSPPASSGS